ncbi:MAG TPA: ABC transporter ATP-binding protein [Salinisphaeraceae bacterium]|nr:ABC transporter ATP-binding protein [Salinisphaeraceae bacterium]
MQLDLDGITHYYGELAALANINLSIRSGEVVALIGPSGCGKSTLLSIIGGLLKPSAGTVHQVGAAPAGCVNPLTYVFQDFALLPWRTVDGNLRLVLKDHGLSRGEQDRRINAVLEQTGLADFRAAFPKQLSGGMRQRVGIARALAVNPAVLLLDEPLSALDAQTRTILMDEFSTLFASAGITAVYVTHNLGEAVRLAHRVVALSRRPGRIKRELVIPLPLAERREGMAELAACEAELWQQIRAEAIAADQELAHGS